MSVWLVMLLGGLATFAIRLSFILAFGRVAVPPALHRALRFVPAAVLSAIVFPEVFLAGGAPDLGAGNERIWAAAAAVAVALATRRTLPTLAAGMTVLLLLQAL